MERTLISDTAKHIGKQVLIKGWVVSVREYGKLRFFDVRDRSGTLSATVDTPRGSLPGQYVVTGVTGTVQVVMSGSLSTPLREWDVVEIEGLVKERPEKLKNPNNLDTGNIEIQVSSSGVNVIAQAKPSPLPLQGDGYDINEDLRLRYRYLDLRRPRLLKNLKVREEVKEIIRHFLRERGFVEIETPYLTKSTPEGARDFLVPSRLEPGKVYALPQSPQQYKQLLMLSGVERYFQFPRNFRDEDLRGDRMLEFTQLDLEMAFTFQEEVLQLAESLVVAVTEKLGKHIQDRPFPRITFKGAMNSYGTDKPDIRKDKNDPNLMAYVWITDFPMFEEKDDGALGAVHHAFSAVQEQWRGRLSGLSRQEIVQIPAQQYDLALNGYEIFGGSIREHNADNLVQVLEALGHERSKIERDFGHLLEAFSYGIPPHGGIASGFDRWMQALLGEQSIREVVAFPTNGSGKTAVMDSPSAPEPEQLAPLGIQFVKAKKLKKYKAKN